MFDKKEPKEIVIHSTTNNYYCEPEKCHPKGNPVHLFLKLKSNNTQIFQIMALSIATNQQVVGTLGLVDQVTNQPVTSSFSEITATSDNTGIFTGTVNPDNTVTVAAVSQGAGTLTVAALCAYTDSTGASQSQSLSVQIPVTITAVVTADAVSLVVNFGTPTAK